MIEDKDYMPPCIPHALLVTGGNDVLVGLLT